MRWKASQWSRPIMLQSATFLGAWGISFSLVLLNAGIASYGVRIVDYARTKAKTLCPEFYLALLVFVSLTFLQTRHIKGQEREPLFRAAAGAGGGSRWWGSASVACARSDAICTASPSSAEISFPFDPHVPWRSSPSACLPHLLRRAFWRGDDRHRC